MKVLKNHLSDGFAKRASFLLISLFLLSTQTATALSQEQSALFAEGINYFNSCDSSNGGGSTDSSVDVTGCCSSSASGSDSAAATPSAGTPPAGDNNSLDLTSIAQKYNLQSAVVDEVGGSRIGDFNADTPPVTPASTMKLIIADTLIRSGISLDKTVKITSDMVYTDASTGSVKDVTEGQSPTLGHAMDVMLEISSNTAANALMSALGGFSSITSKAQSYGYKNTTIKLYYSPAGDAVNKSTIGDEADAMNHIFTTNGSDYSQAQKDLETAAKIDNYYSVADDANKWAGTSQVAGDVAKISGDSADYIIGVYINENDATAVSKGDIKNAVADIVSAISDSPSSDTSDTGQCCSGASLDTAGGTPSTSTTINGFPNDQVKTFASEPITSTWNISDSTVEQWFLKQSGAEPVIGRYGLNSGDIGQITSAVEAANVSPVFFYLYAVNEGGTQSGANDGFINHTSRDGLSGPEAATADAQYIATYSKATDTNPSWEDAGNPVNFVPQSVQTAGNADFQNMPLGSIGRIYIPATAAATWEVYYPQGLSAAYNKVQDYGPPLSGAMQNIKDMGGDPSQGGATVSTTSAGGCGSGGVTGQGMAAGISFALFIANDEGYGYDQPSRETGWEKYQSDQSCSSRCGSFDCSSFVSAIVTEAGYFKKNPNFATGTEAAELTQAGFTNVTSSVNITTGANMQPGDILVNTANHTAMYIGDDKMVAARINENGGIAGGQVGDQNGQEITTEPYSNYPDGGWDGVYRAPAN